MSNQSQNKKQKVILAYLHAPTTLPEPFGFSSVTTLSDDKTPGLNMELGDQGLLLRKGDAMLLIPFAGIKVMKFDRP